MVPPAALAVHLYIGQAYAFSVFNAPLTRVIGITESAPDDWSLTTLGWIFSLAIVFLGLSVVLAGKWLEKVEPRRTMFTAACCFGGGLPGGDARCASASDRAGLPRLRRNWHWVRARLCLAAVSTLIRWFPDRRDTAIMGFGGGAMIAAPASVALRNHFKSATSNGVTETFVVLGVIYFISMSISVLAIRAPRPNWTPPVTNGNKIITCISTRC